MEKISIREFVEFRSVGFTQRRTKAATTSSSSQLNGKLLRNEFICNLLFLCRVLLVGNEI